MLEKSLYFLEPLLEKHSCLMAYLLSKNSVTHQMCKGIKNTKNENKNICLTINSKINKRQNCWARKSFQTLGGSKRHLPRLSYYNTAPLLLSPLFPHFTISSFYLFAISRFLILQFILLSFYRFCSHISLHFPISAVLRKPSTRLAIPQT